MLATRSTFFKHARLKHPGRFYRPYRLYSTHPESERPKIDPSLPLHTKLIKAWKETPTKWYPLPVAVGALLLAVMDYRKRRARQEVDLNEDGEQVVRLRGPWQVHVLGALPLRSLSRLWGYLNSLELPLWFRPFGFKLYALIFSADLTEIEHDDLTKYTSLGDFFYRRLKPGVRPISSSPLVSPADGRVLHCGEITGAKIEQVKGLTYNVDALLGKSDGTDGEPIMFKERMREIVDDQDFANVNGIEYSLDDLMGRSSAAHVAKVGKTVDASVAQPADNLTRDANVALELGVRPTLQRKSSVSDLREGNKLFFAVIYLAPGDYHRFHSPAAWVVRKRRHFAGELFSVSPYMAKRLANLFVLNERVALLGRWRHGFFGMVPVGATNVGSIKINFDEALRTNVRGRKPTPGTFAEATYSAASPILNGQPLRAGEEIGGFSLGSTIVLIFEAPAAFEFTVGPSDIVKVGCEMGKIETD